MYFILSRLKINHLRNGKMVKNKYIFIKHPRLCVKIIRYETRFKINITITYPLYLLNCPSNRHLRSYTFTKMCTEGGA